MRFAILLLALAAACGSTEPPPGEPPYLGSVAGLYQLVSRTRAPDAPPLTQCESIRTGVEYYSFTDSGSWTYIWSGGGYTTTCGGVVSAWGANEQGSFRRDENHLVLDWGATVWVTGTVTATTFAVDAGNWVLTYQRVPPAAP